MNRDAIIEKLFSIVNYQRKLNHEDPDYILIEKMIEEIPEHRLGDYYLFVTTSRKYHSPSGALLRVKIKDSVEDFIIKIKEEIWKEYDVEAKSVLLTDKIFSLYGATKSLPAEEKKNSFSRERIESVMYITKKGEREKLFTSEEMEIIFDIGIEKLIELCEDGKALAHNPIENGYKLYYTKVYFSPKKEEPKKLSIS